MKLRSNVCNRCHLVRVKFYLNRICFAVVIAKCLGGSLFWGHTVFSTLFYIKNFTYTLFINFIMLLYMQLPQRWRHLLSAFTFSLTHYTQPVIGDSLDWNLGYKYKVRK